MLVKVEGGYIQFSYNYNAAITLFNQPVKRFFRYFDDSLFGCQKSHQKLCSIRHGYSLANQNHGKNITKAFRP